MLKSEDILFDWSMPMYLNYTHSSIIDRIEEFFLTLGKVERIQGEVFVYKDSFDCLELGELPSSEVVTGLVILIVLLAECFHSILGDEVIARRRC
jgi:hypothetical protein